jgi:phage terminase large subunit-like protein
MPTDPEGEFFKIGRIQIETVPPVDICKIQNGEIFDIVTGIRYWDLAATKKSMEARDPDYTCGTLLAESKEDRRFWILDSIRAQADPEQVEDMVIQYAKLDGPKVKIRIEQEPGASGTLATWRCSKILTTGRCWWRWQDFQMCAMTIR